MLSCRFLMVVVVLAGVFAGYAEPYRDGDVVVFFGDSITHAGHYHEYISNFYRTRYPDRCIRFVNSGIGGDTAARAFSRIPEDVAEYKPTHVTFHFGMNDVNRGSYRIDTTAKSLKERAKAQEDYRTNLCALVEGVRRVAPDAKFTYLTPTPYDDSVVLTNAPTFGWAAVNQVGCSVGLSLLAGHVIAAAERDGAACVDWYSVLNGFIRRHQKDDPHFTVVRPDRVHPEELGHSVMAWEFLRRQGVSPVVSAVTVDATKGHVEGVENAEISDLRFAERRVEFTLCAKSLPFPVHPKALPYVAEFAIERTLNRETLTVRGLPGGEYSLKIDGEEVGRYVAKQLADGIGLGFNVKTPQYRQAQDVARQQAKLFEREVILRNHHSARWYFGDKGPVDDIPAFRTYYEAKVKSGKAPQWTGYFGRFIPGYLEYWPKYKEVRAQLWKDQEQVRKLACPVPHVYVIEPAVSVGTQGD